MAHCVRVRVSGRVPVPCAPAEAFELFTPEGERRWADGWAPHYPAGGGETAEPGTVFVTGAHGEHTLWTVLRHEPGREIAYSRVTPGERAGVVSVACEPAPDGTTIAAVSYDLTALHPGANAAVEAFAEGYDAFLEDWRVAIAGSLGAG